MNFRALYADKLTTAEEAVKVVRSGDWVDYGFGAILPVALDNALAARKDELEEVHCRGGTELWVPAVVQVPAHESPFTWNSLHMAAGVRQLMGQGNIFYLPMRFSETPRYFRENVKSVDVAMFQFPPMGEDGYFRFGIGATHTAAICERAKHVIIEVNRNMPACRGGEETKIHISQVSMVVEGDNPSLEMAAARGASPEEAVIARLIAEDVPSGACLQLGIGNLSNMVGEALAQTDIKNLGVHSEMYVDAFVVLAKAGKVTGSLKALDRGRQVFSFAAGSKELYEYIDDNPEVYSAPIDYVNDVRVISALDNFISVNGAVEVDLFGQVNAETAGLRHISGSGGQQDFVLGAYLSRGGKSFIALPSTHTGKDGTVKSRIAGILARGGVVTDTRTNAHYIVTEHGKANLKGLAAWERAEALIAIAAPRFQDQLVGEAEKMGIWRRSNRRG